MSKVGASHPIPTLIPIIVILIFKLGHFTIRHLNHLQHSILLTIISAKTKQNET